MIHQYEKAIEESKSKFYEHEPVANGWKLEVTEGKNTVHIKTNPTNGLNIARTALIVENIDFNKFFTFMSQLMNRAFVDPNFECKIISQIDANTTLYYCKGKPPVMFVDARDFILIRRIVKISDDEYLLVDKSVEHPDYPPIKGVVRGEFVFSCISYKKISPTETRVISVSNMDPKGDLPKMVLNQGAGRGLQFYGKMIEYCKAH